MPRVLWVKQNVIRVDFRNGRLSHHKLEPDKDPYRSRKMEFYNALCNLSYDKVKSLLGTPPSIDNVNIDKEDPTPLNVMIYLLKPKNGEQIGELSRRRARIYNLMNLLLEAGVDVSQLREVVLPDPLTPVEFLILQGVRRRAGLLQDTSPSF